MKTELVRMRNYQGVRLPQEIIQQWGLVKSVEITIENNKVIISPIQSRQGWEEAFQEMTENQDDELLIDDKVTHSWDESDWQW